MDLRAFYKLESEVIMILSLGETVVLGRKKWLGTFAGGQGYGSGIVWNKWVRRKEMKRAKS